MQSTREGTARARLLAGAEAAVVEPLGELARVLLAGAILKAEGKTSSDHPHLRTEISADNRVSRACEEVTFLAAKGPIPTHFTTSSQNRRTLLKLSAELQISMFFYNFNMAMNCHEVLKQAE